jgi:hypothetical protein
VGVVGGHTHTTLIDEVYPSGWTAPPVGEAGRAVAACAASVPPRSVSGTSSNAEPSPFITIGRRLP